MFIFFDGLKYFKFREIWLSILKFKTFPLLNASTSLFNGLFSWLPIYFITIKYNFELLGLYFLVNRLISAPLSLVGASLSPLILKESANLLLQKKNLLSYVFKIIFILTISSIFIGIVMYFGSIFFIRFALSNEWAASQSYIIYLLPLALVKFITSTPSTIFESTHRNDLLAIWKISSFIISFLTFSYFITKLSFNEFLVCILIVETLIYLYQMSLIIVAAVKPKYKF